MSSINCEANPFVAKPGGPLVIVISGPSGVGKDAILNRMKKRGSPFVFIVTSTTRPKRPTEKSGVDYNFITEQEFEQLLQNDGFLESARVYGNWYGVPRKAVKEALAKGKDSIIKVDVQGSATLKKILPEAIFIFVSPPSLEELSARLSQRQTESSSNLQLRLNMASEEMKQINNFDFVVLNHRNEIDRTIEQILAIISAEKCRVKPRAIVL